MLWRGIGQVAVDGRWRVGKEVADILNCTGQVLILEVHPRCHSTVEDISHVALHAAVLSYGCPGYPTERGGTERVVCTTEQRTEVVN